MKFLIALLFTPFLAHSNPMDDAINTAKLFCGDNEECINVLALELDSSYYEGLSTHLDKDEAFKQKFLSLEDLCVKAPDLEICESYKSALLERYIAGISK